MLEELMYQQTTANNRPKYLFTLWLCLNNYVCFADALDNQQMIQFRADSADMSQSTHLGTYLGHVQLDQGTTHIRAAEAFTKGNQKNQLIKAVIKGDNKTQAHYWTLPTNGKPLVHAYADIMNYYPQKNVIELLGHARVHQGNNSFSAPKIMYNTLDQHVISSSEGQERTTIIIYPEKNT